MTFNSPIEGLEDRVCLITGAAGGIGRATAHQLATAGAKLALVDRDEVGLEQTIQGLLHAGVTEGDMSATIADVTNAGTVDDYMDRVVGRFGRLDALFNNAGVEGPVAGVEAYLEEDLDRTLAINVKGVWLNMRSAIPRMRRFGGGSIINNASSAGALRSLPCLSAYVASKHAVLGLTRTAAVELARSCIRVNAICPGPIDTPMMRTLELQAKQTTVAEARAAYASNVPMGRYGQPEEVGRLVVFLISEGASFITGAVICADGGASAA